MALIERIDIHFEPKEHGKKKRLKETATRCIVTFIRLDKLPGVGVFEIVPTSVQSERYMNTPQENPEGYKKTSVVAAAAQLHGRLLLIHGIMDDNVHVQNSLQLVRAFQRADKDFELMVYPSDRHGIRGKHYQRLVLDFMRRTLKPENKGDNASLNSRE